MADIITLGIAVDSTRVSSASNALTTLSSSAQTAQTATDRFTRELTAADVAAGRYTDTSGRMREANGQFVVGMNQATQATDNASTSIVSLRTVLASLAGVVSTAFALDTIIEFQDAMLGLEATSGATAEQMLALENQARTLGATSVFSASQVGGAQKFLAQAGLDTNEILKATASTLNLASAGALDLATSADIATNVLGGMQLPVEELGRVVDVLASSAASANTDVGQLGSALSKTAPIAAAASISLEDTAAAIGILSNNGLQAEVAATGLSGVIRQLLDISPKAEKALSGYGLSAADVNIEARGLSQVLTTLSKVTISAEDAFTIFGSEAAAAGLILKSSSAQFDELSKSLKGAEGSAMAMANIYSSELSGAFASFNSAVEESILQLGKDSGLANALQEVVASATGVISVYTGMLPQFAQANDLSADQVKNLILVADASEAVAVGLGIAATAAIGMATATKTVTAATWLLTAALNANPLVRVATLLGAAAVAVGVYMGATQSATEANNILKESTESLNDTIAKSSRTYAYHGQVIGTVNENKLNLAIETAEAAIKSAESQVSASNAIIEGYNSEIKAAQQLILHKKALIESGLITSGDQEEIEIAKSNIEQLTALIAFETKSLELSSIALERNGLNVLTLKDRLKKLNDEKKGQISTTSKLSDAQKEHNKLISEGLSLTESLRSPQEVYNDSLERYTNLLNQSVISEETYSRAKQKAIDDLNKATGATQDNIDELQTLEDQQQKTFDAWSDNISGLITGTKDLDDVLANLAQTLLQKAFVDPLLISVGINGTANGINLSAGQASAVGAGADGFSISSIADVVSNGFNVFDSGLQSGFSNFATSGLGQSIGLSTAQTLPAGFIGPANIGLSGTGEFLSGGFTGFSAGGGIAANLLGLGSGDALTDTVTSTLGGAIGNSLLPGIGGAIGSFLGTAVGGLFGGSNKPTAYTFESQGTRGDVNTKNTSTIFNEFGQSEFHVSRGRDNAQEITDAMTSVLQTISDLESNIAKTLDDDQIERVTQNVADADFIKYKDPDEAIEAYVGARLDVILNEVDPAIKKLTEEYEAVGVASLHYASTIVAINEAAQNGGPLLDLFNGNIESTVNFLDQIKTEDGTLADSFAALQQVQASYYQNFFSEQERIDDAVEAATEALDSFNSQIGLVGDAAIDTKQEFRNYIEAQDLTTEAGREAVIQALELQQSLLLVADASSQAADEALALQTQLSNNAAQARLDYYEYAAVERESRFDSVDSALANTNSIIDDRISYLNDQISANTSAYNTNASAISSLSNSVNSALSRFVSASGQDSQINDSYRAIISAATSGQVNADKLSDALNNVQAPAESLYSSFNDYQRDLLTTASDISNLDVSTATALGVSQRTLSTMRSGFEDEIKKLEEMREEAQTQVDLLSNVDNSVKTVADAIEELSNAILSAKSAITTNNTSISDDSIRAFVADNTSQVGTISTAEGISLYHSAIENGVSSSQVDSALGLEKGTALNFAIANGLPAFAKGGLHTGGARIVGENGPELEITGPARIMNNSDLMSSISKKSNDSSSINTDYLLSKLLNITDRLYRMSQKWDEDGLKVNT